MKSRIIKSHIIKSCLAILLVASSMVHAAEKSVNYSVKITDAAHHLAEGTGGVPGVVVLVLL